MSFAFHTHHHGEVMGALASSRVVGVKHQL